MNFAHRPIPILPNCHKSTVLALNILVRLIIPKISLLAVKVFFALAIPGLVSLASLDTSKKKKLSRHHHCMFYFFLIAPRAMLMYFTAKSPRIHNVFDSKYTLVELMTSYKYLGVSFQSVMALPYLTSLASASRLFRFFKRTLKHTPSHLGELEYITSHETRKKFLLQFFLMQSDCPKFRFKARNSSKDMTISPAANLTTELEQHFLSPDL